MTFERDQLQEALEESFDADPIAIENVVDQAVALRNSGKWEEVSDSELTAEFIVEKVEEAKRPLAASWNWWIGSLDYFEAGFKQYQVDG